MAEKRGLFQGVGGNRAAGKVFSLDGFGENLVGSVLSCGLNAAGGAAALFVGEKIDHWKPGYGTLGIALLSIGIKAAVQPVSDGAVAFRELAAGMAGYVGDEVFEGLMLMWRSTKWTAGKVWKTGELVSHDGKYYVASEDLQADGGKPGEDKRWKEHTSARFGVADLKECSKLVFSDKQRVDTISSFISSQLGKARGWNDQEIAGAKADISGAMGKIAEEAAKL